MRAVPLAAALIACVLPLAVAAQPGPPPGGYGPPSPEVREKIEHLRAAAKTAAYAALTADHRSKVGAIVERVKSRVLEPRAGAAEIDALLGTDEKKNVLAAARHAREEMRTAMGMPPREGGPPQGGPPPEGGPPPDGGAGAPVGPPPSPGGPDGGGARRPQSDAGRYLLFVSLDPRSMRPQRPPGAPQ